MAMTTIAFPTLKRLAPSEFEWGLRANQFEFRSQFTGTSQILEVPGAQWYFRATWRNLLDDDAAAMRAFMSRLKGRYNRFTYYNVLRYKPRGVASGSPTVNGGSQTGNSLVVANAGTVTGWLLEDDYIGVGNFLYQVTATVNSSGGAATIPIEPALRASPTNGAAVTITRPTGRFRMLSPAWTTPGRPFRGPGNLLSDITIDAVEDLNP